LGIYLLRQHRSKWTKVLWFFLSRKNKAFWFKLAANGGSVEKRAMEPAAARKQAIREEAARLFLRDGFEHARLREVGRCIGSPDAPRHYFGHKAGLLAEVIGNHSVSLLVAVELGMPAGLFRMALAYADAASESREAHMVTLREARHLADAAQADFRTRNGMLRLLFAQEFQTKMPLVSEAATDQAAILLLAMLDTLVRLRQVSDRSVRAATEAAMTVLRMLS
jgi:hypothetical protein